MIKTFKNLLWNQKADDLESWYADVALVTQVLQICSNGDPGLTLTYVTARSNFVPFLHVNASAVELSL